MTLDSRLNEIFTFRNLWFGRGEETPQFEGTMVIKNRDVAIVKNRGTGGPSFYQWVAPFTEEWAQRKLYPLVVKVASHKEPEFAELYARSPGTALDSLVFDVVETQRLSRGSLKVAPPSAPEGLQQGTKVEFGRQNGEKTIGKVLKINKKSVLVETLEARGSKYRPGTKFRVHPALLTIVS